MSRYDHIDPAELGKKAWKSASRAAKHMSKHSRIVNPALEKCIPRFERGEVKLGEFLGSGGFNDVYEIKRIDLVKSLEEAVWDTLNMLQPLRSSPLFVGPWD